MENLIFLFHFLRLTLLHYIYPNPRLSFHFFILFWLLCAFYYCKSLLPTIGRLDPRVPPGSVLLYSTVKLAPTCTIGSANRSEQMQNLSLSSRVLTRLPNRSVCRRRGRRGPSLQGTHPVPARSMLRIWMFVEMAEIGSISLYSSRRSILETLQR